MTDGFENYPDPDIVLSLTVGKAPNVCVDFKALDPYTDTLTVPAAYTSADGIFIFLRFNLGVVDPDIVDVALK